MLLTSILLAVAISMLATSMASAFAPTSLYLGGGPASKLTAPTSITTTQLHSEPTSGNARLASPSAEPRVFFQSRIAEPANVESVPSAAYLLSETFPKEPFAVRYRSTNIYDTDVECSRPVLDLSVLREIEIDSVQNLIKVDAGVTVDALATELAQWKTTNAQTGEDASNPKNVFGALPADGYKTVVEAALYEPYTKFRNIVQEIHVVTRDGKIVAKPLAKVDAREDIIVNVVLAPSPQGRTTGLVARWYTRKQVDTPIPEDFVSQVVAEDVKILVHKYGLFNIIPNIVIMVDGDRDLCLSEDEWNEIRIETPEELWCLQNDLAEDGAFGCLTASQVLSTNITNPPFLEVVANFSTYRENLAMWFEKGQIRANFDARYPPDLDDAMDDIFDFDGMSRSRNPRIITIDAQDDPLMSGYTAASPIVTRGTVIPGFEGEVYDGVRGRMQEKRFQYATSSYDNMMNPSLIAYPKTEQDIVRAIEYATLPKYAEARKTPAHPSGHPFKVIGRGGGHQYCGVSCDNDALIISMDEFTKLEWVNFEEPKNVTGPDGRPQLVSKEVHVGTGVKLKEFATFMNNDTVTGLPARGCLGWRRRSRRREPNEETSFGATIPHGECPTVGIGGHSQTGGYGHIVRSFGLAIDYIYGFTIVTADGTIRTVNRDSKDPADKDLYWAVLGGSPGAFGITTNLIIHPILDEDYPNSTAYSAYFLYRKDRMREVLKILEDFINRSQKTDENAISEGLDLMTSLGSNNGNRILRFLNQEKDNIIPGGLSVIAFELVCRDKKDRIAYDQFKEIISKFEANVNPTFLMGLFGRIARVNLHDGETHYKLSELSLDFTRKPPLVTNGGRESRKPYRKIMYGSKDKLKEGWSEDFAELLHDIRRSRDDITGVFQVVVGGGAQTRFGEANLNSIAHRDAQLHGIVLDMFRGESDASIKAADAFSTRFEMDIVNKYQTAYPKVMAQWASHGDLDMNKQSVWENYFDKPETYHKLRRIKKEVDPDDIFHSRFSIRPAED